MDDLYPESLLRETWFEALLSDIGLGPDEGPGGLVVVGDEASMCAMSWGTLVKETPSSDLEARIENQIRLAEGREAWVGV